MTPNERYIRSIERALDDAYKATFSSELHCIIDHLRDVISNVEYDIRAGNCPSRDVPAVLEQQLNGTIDTFREELDGLSNLLKRKLNRG